MWSFAVLLWELVTREVPFADLSHMEIGMKVGKTCVFTGFKPNVCLFVDSASIFVFRWHLRAFDQPFHLESHLTYVS